MNLLLAVRNLTLRRWRTLFLLLGYALGVAVMIVLLSIGEALVTQAREEKLVGGGNVTVLPEGIDVEVMKTGGLGGLFFSIENARFLYHQLIASPRNEAVIAAAAPGIEGELMYLRAADGVDRPVRANGEIPSRSALVGAGPDITSGAWRDDSSDRRWISPTAAELRHDIDHFHLPPPEAQGDDSWAEWHYFNVLSSDRRRWAFVTLMVGGAMPDGRWGGQVLVTLHEDGRVARRFTSVVGAERIRMSTIDANVSLGDSFVRLRDDGSYEVRARATSTESGATARVDLVVHPAPRVYFPGTTLSRGQTFSGYAVPALRATASGSICISDQCDRYENDQSYHDHNWGLWRNVQWEWGAARAGEYTFLYGRVEPSDSTIANQPLFLYLTDSLGFLSLFRPRVIDYEDSRLVRVNGREMRVPARARMVDARDGDTLVVELEIEAQTVTDTRDALTARGATITRPYFVQMKGLARLRGRVRGRVIAGEGSGFFETYR